MSGNASVANTNGTHHSSVTDAAAYTSGASGQLYYQRYCNEEGGMTRSCEVLAVVCAAIAGLAFLTCLYYARMRRQLDAEPIRKLSSIVHLESLLCFDMTCLGTILIINIIPALLFLASQGSSVHIMGLILPVAAGTPLSLMCFGWAAYRTQKCSKEWREELAEKHHELQDLADDASRKSSPHEAAAGVQPEQSDGHCIAVAAALGKQQEEAASRAEDYPVERIDTSPQVLNPIEDTGEAYVEVTHLGPEAEETLPLSPSTELATRYSPLPTPPLSARLGFNRRKVLPPLKMPKFTNNETEALHLKAPEVEEDIDIEQSQDDCEDGEHEDSIGAHSLSILERGGAVATASDAANCESNVLAAMVAQSSLANVIADSPSVRHNDSSESGPRSRPLGVVNQSPLQSPSKSSV